VSLRLSYNSFDDLKDKHNKSMADNTEQSATMRCKIDELNYKLKVTDDDLNKSKELYRTLDHKFE
jgi:hypothetical protein